MGKLTLQVCDRAERRTAALELPEQGSSHQATKGNGGGVDK